MSISERLRQYSEVLVSIAETLLAEEADTEAYDSLCQREGRDRLEFGPSPLPFDKARQLDVPSERAYRVFKDALTITLQVPAYADFGDDPPDPLVLRGSGDDKDRITALLKKCEEHFVDHLLFEIAIDKRTLLDEIRSELGGSKTDQVILFFCGQRLLKVLAGYRSNDFESNFLRFDDQVKRFLVLVADRRGRAVGPYLTLLGSDESSSFESILREPPPAGDASDILRAMRKHCNWDTRPKRLTPSCLWLAAGNDGLRECQEAMTRLQNELSLGFLANRSTQTAAGLRCTFEGERTVEILVGRSPQKRAGYQLYRWAYEDLKTVAVRLEIVRRVVTSHLAMAAVNDAIQLLMKTGSQLLKECRIQLGILIDRNLVESFSRRQEVRKLVRSYVDDVSKQIGALAKEAVDNTYRTVGLLVGVAIAYLLKPAEGALILAAGVGLYLAYVAFVRFFYIGSIKADYESHKRRFEQEKDHIAQSKLISAKDLFDPVAESERQFDSRWQVVNVVYSVLLAAGLLLLLVVLYSLTQTSVDQIKVRALKLQAERFAAMGYTDIRAGSVNGSAPAPMTDQATGETETPDVSAISPERHFVVLRYIPCGEIGKQDELARLRRFHQLAQSRGYRLHLLMPAVCGRRSGSEAVRSWIEANNLPTPVLWSYD